MENFQVNSRIRLKTERDRIGVIQSGPKKLAGDNSIVPYISETFKPLIRDIRASFDYFEGLMGGSIQKVYLSGGGSLTRGIVDLFKERLGVSVLLWNPLRQIDDSALMDKDKEFLISHSSFLSVCMGIAETSS